MSEFEQGPNEPHIDNPEDRAFFTDLSRGVEYNQRPAEGYVRAANALIQAWDRLDPRDQLYSKAITASLMSGVYVDALYRKPTAIGALCFVTGIGAVFGWGGKVAKDWFKENT
ncbi:MAG: hypothetical protein WDN66_03050 [Candidatus Saccharibacteria bacterium]